MIAPLLDLSSSDLQLPTLYPKSSACSAGCCARLDSIRKVDSIRAHSHHATTVRLLGKGASPHFKSTRKLLGEADDELAVRNQEASPLALDFLDMAVYNNIFNQSRQRKFAATKSW
jgi:hypothetical protein